MSFMTFSLRVKALNAKFLLELEYSLPLCMMHT